MQSKQEIPEGISIKFTAERDDVLFGSPKRVEIRNEAMKLIDSKWVLHDEYTNPTIAKGVYNVAISFESGIVEERVVDVNANNKHFNISLDGLYPDRNNILRNYRRYFGESKSLIKQLRFPAIRLWQQVDRKWEPVDSFLAKISNEYRDGVRAQFSLSDRRYLLQIRNGTYSTSRFVCLPRYEKIVIEFFIASFIDKDSYPFQIRIITENQTAETILSLINQGFIKEAESLLSAEQAEGLLYDKVLDTSAAAIGGYYLLKIRDFERMHDWAYNLATRFPWLPDGSIIFAWQLLKEQRLNIEIDPSNINTIRQYLLEAFDRGLPMYTEGMRLLYEGLNLLHIYKKSLKIDDSEVTSALTKVGSYIDAIDWTQPMTTFEGELPTEPKQ